MVALFSRFLTLRFDVHANGIGAAEAIGIIVVVVVVVVETATTVVVLLL